MEATAKELRFHAREILESAMRGEEVVITLRGKPAAKLVPIGKRSAGAGNGLFGIWADKHDTDDVNGYVRRLRKGRRHAG